MAFFCLLSTPQPPAMNHCGAAATALLPPLLLPLPLMALMLLPLLLLPPYIELLCNGQPRHAALAFFCLLPPPSTFLRLASM